MVDSNKNKIWREFVDYANAPDLGSNPEVSKNLAQTLSRCMPWMARSDYDEDVPAMIATLTNREVLFGQVGEKRVWLCLKSEEQLANQFRQQAIDYQPQVRHLLTWLADRSQNAQDKPHAVAFLREHMKHIEFHRGDPAFAPDEEQFRYFTAGGDLKDDFPYRTLFYKDLADVICDFVHKENEPGRDMPIRLCKRPGCGKLVTQFKKRQYCRTAQCDHERQKRDDDLKQRKNRDSVFLWRLGKMKPGPRRDCARKNANRLREIESYWREKNQSLTEHALKLLAEAL